MSDVHPTEGPLIEAPAPPVQPPTPAPAVPGFKLTEKQQHANRVLGSESRHILLYGGSRSGKTFLIIRAIVYRALAYKSRHAVLRFRFNHVRASVVNDTLTKVMDLCFPGVMKHCKMDRQDWFLKFPNGSEIWFAGLDDKERTEKILGAEYASLFLNECSQIPFASRNIAVTRLAQQTPLRLKCYYDCNPPAEGHWIHRLFIDKKHPDSKQPLQDPENYASLQINPADNLQNLPADYLRELEALPDRLRRRFLLGLFGSGAEQALWTIEILDVCRFSGESLPDMQRVVVAVDPSGAKGPEDKRSDEIGIVVVGLGVDGKGYVLEDLSGRFGPAEWGRIAVSAFDRHAADAVVAESNYGGEMVAHVMRTAATSPERRSNYPVPVRMVHASRGKVVRAEPIASLFDQQKVLLNGYFPLLEDELCAMTVSGYAGEKSPNRADAMVWGLTQIFPAIAKKDDPDRLAMPRVNIGYQRMKGFARRLMQ